MPQDPLPDPGSLSPAESLFAQYLAEVELGGAPDFEAVCKAHPAAARGLRELKSHWERLRTIEHKAGLGGKPRAALADELRSRFGSDVDPGVSRSGAEPNEDSGPSSELLRRLQAHQPANSRYKLLGEVGRGGMGAVLKIWDEDLRRTLAMKVVLGKDDPAKPGSTPPVDSRTLGRFLEEAQVTGQLDHPGIVPVHELGLDSTGRDYFTMRLVKGEDLRRIYEHVESGRDGWNETRALGVLLKVCEAMSYAHDKSVVHRDLKPANVMVGKYGEVYVMDWGLARVLGEKDRHDVRLKPEAPTSASIRTERRSERDETPDSPLVTMDGDVVGTPAYMPPEQARGDVDQLGPHSDVYAVGAMLYHLLARQMPFVPPHARVSAHMVLMRVLEGPPKPLIEFAPQTPAELVAICEKAMERDPKLRYRDMVELAEDLRAYLERRVVKAYESGTWAETKKWVQRNRPLAVSLASAVVVLVAGVITSLLYADEANAARKELSEKNTALTEATQLAEARAETESRLKNEALKREREGKMRGLIQELEYFETLDDDVYTYARQQTRPAYEWWIEGARKLVDGVEEDLDNNVPWSPGLKDVEAELAKVRERALPRTPEEIEADHRAHPRFAEYERQRLELQWMSRMLGKEPWPSEEEIEAQLAKEELPKTASELNDLAAENPDAPVHGQELRALLLARRALAAAEKELTDTEAKHAAWERKEAEALSNAGSTEPTDTSTDDGFTSSKDRAWSAGQATGAPDADPAINDRRAWAYANPGPGAQWLEVRFDPPARATNVRIHEVNVAGGVALVLATDAERGLHTLFQGQDPTQRPGVFELPVGDKIGALASLRIVIDASRSSTWHEIDAVELVTAQGSVWASSARASSEFGEESEPEKEHEPAFDSGVANAIGTRDRTLRTFAWAQWRAGLTHDSRVTVDRFRAQEPELERALRAWTDASELAQREHERAEKEQALAALRVETEAQGTWSFSTSDDTWWHKQLMSLSANLRGVSKRVEFALASVVEAESARAWDAAIEAIAKSDRYRETKWPSGERLTRQLGLVPIGPDPATGLWEFAHLATGRPARRGADGKLVLEPETGLVMVLLPGGRVPRADSTDQGQDETLTRVDLDPFFVSKFEMTRGQWDRIGGWKRPGLEAGDPLLPAADLSWEDCQVALPRAGWLRLSTEAQWEYACRARTRSQWWTGNDSGQLRGVAKLAFANDLQAPRGVQRCGSLRANPFGLHDVHGNVWEWCQDALGVGERREGDGLREEPSAAPRVVRGGSCRDEPESARSSPRYGFTPGFRVVVGGLRPSQGIAP